MLEALARAKAPTEDAAAEIEASPLQLSFEATVTVEPLTVWVSESWGSARTPETP